MNDGVPFVGAVKSLEVEVFACYVAHLVRVSKLYVWCCGVLWSWCWSCWLVLNASTRSCFSWLASFWAFNVFFFSSCTLFRVFFQASSKYAAAVFSSLSSLISAGLPSHTLSSTHTGQTTEREQIVFPFKIKSSANLQIKYIIPAPLA